jgi:RNA polymerase primary sigma factor
MTPEQSIIIRDHMSLVRRMALRLYRPGHMDLSDLEQEGALGLMRAVELYDPSRGIAFVTYATWWIRHAITRARANKDRTVRVPVHVLGLNSTLFRLSCEFEAAHGRPPDDDELAQAAGLPGNKIKRHRSIYMETCELDGLPTLKDEATPAPDEFVERLQQAALEDAAAKFIDRLPPVQADVLRRRLGLHGGKPMTLQEIGDLHGRSRQRVQQIQAQALSALRSELQALG